MSSKYGDGDGNLYALDKYLARQDERDAAWESIVKKVGNDVEENATAFSEVMDEFHALKRKIASELDDYGLDDSEEVVLQIMFDCGDDSLMEQMNSIDW